MLFLNSIGYSAGNLIAQATVQEIVDSSTPAGLEAAVAAAAIEIGANQIGVFKYGADTYVFGQDGDASVATTDMLIKLQGEHTLDTNNFIF